MSARVGGTITIVPYDAHMTLCRQGSTARIPQTRNARPYEMHAAQCVAQGRTSCPPAFNGTITIVPYDAHMPLCLVVGAATCRPYSAGLLPPFNHTTTKIPYPFITLTKKSNVSFKASCSTAATSNLKILNII